MESEWREVRRRKTFQQGNEGRRFQASSWSWSRSRKELFEGSAKTFYLTNLSEGSTEADLWRIFKRIGKVVDIYLAKKKNKLGERFGFARFLGITDPDGFERKLRNTWVGERKLHANLARFERKKQGTKTAQGITETLEANRGTHQQFAAAGRSFADVVANNPNTSSLQNKIRLSSIGDNREFLKKVLVGRVACFMLLQNLENSLFSEGCSGIKIKFLGGLHVALEFEEERLASSFLQDAREVWSNWFVNLAKWDSGFRAEGRLASVLFYGVPPHAWTPETFGALASKFGDVSISDGENRNMSIGRVGIFTKKPLWINESFAISIDEIDFQILAVEDTIESLKLVPSSTNSEAFSGSDDSSEDFSSSKDGDDGGDDDLEDFSSEGFRQDNEGFLDDVVVPESSRSPEISQTVAGNSERLDDLHGDVVQPPSLGNTHARVAADDSVSHPSLANTVGVPNESLRVDPFDKSTSFNPPSEGPNPIVGQESTPPTLNPSQVGVSIGTGYPLLEPEPLWNRRFRNRNRCEWFRFRFLKYGTDTGYPVSEPEPAVPGPVPKYEEPVQPVPVPVPSF
ncbi:hypothetical protein OSB04_un000949 [Centaurea solstitialis]|uniref:RRM domain-containing protein n=1 Tax=Centaurea solstitialis TaxID=347529 RepID=A0AA38SBM7_9ASTR|nr:hypothetical protein OSB04_un000949 [Centaurea solstitialis]